MESASATAQSSTSELPFERPKTAREEAAAIERSKRDAEMAELKRLRSEQNENQRSTQPSASDTARKKREDEMEEIRRLKAGENAQNRKRLSEMGGPLTTDMDAWRSNQWGAKDADRQKKLEAQSSLQGHRGYHETKTEAALDKAAYTQAQRERMAAMAAAGLSLGEDGHPPEGEWAQGEAEERPHGVTFKDARTLAMGEPGEAVERPREVMFKDAYEEIPIPKEKDRLRVSFSSATAGAPLEATLVEEDTPPKPELAPAADPEPERKMPPEKIETSLPVATPVATEKEKKPVSSTKYFTRPPSYSRVDIKFSFGLIVRSTAAEGFDDSGENLRDNETLRKCMEGTSKILTQEMPSAPDYSAKEQRQLVKSKFPEAYYNPKLEPTIISIEEDKKGDKTSTAKGNKRTLVKASFPVFLRDEAVDEEGKRRSTRMLKETKTLVFKALRAAVSGGSFLR